MTSRFHFATSVITAWLLILSNAAYAQAPAPPASGTDTRPPAPTPVDAGMAVGTSSAPSTSIAPEALDDARVRVRLGELLFLKGDYNGALSEYERAYELVPGHAVRYVALFNIGKCYEKLFRYDKALEYYRRYLDQSPPDAPNRSEVGALVAELLARLAVLNIDVNVPAEVWVSGHAVGRAPGRILVPAGSLSVELRARGYEAEAFSVQIASREAHTRRVVLEKLSDVTGASPTWFWTSTVATGVSLAVGSALGVAALNADAAIERRLADPVEQWRPTRGDDARVQDLALASDVAFGASALFGATSVVLFFLTDWDGSAEASSSASVRLDVQIDPHQPGAMLRGAF